jgi:phosphoglycerol transferase MdoB-like AlkP superfamily enzyme
MHYFSRKSPILWLGVVYLFISMLLRLILLFHPITQSSFSVLELLKIVVFGLCSDIFVYVVGSLFLWLYLLFLSNKKLEKPYGYILFGCFVALLAYIYFGNTILNEYGGSLPEIGLYFISLKTVLIGLLVFLPRYRKTIRLVLFSFTIFLFLLIIVQNAISEFFFWNEFGVRYNFIAVDYLIYTNTVIGNIMESYPVVPLFLGVGIVTLLLTYWVVKKSNGFLDELPNFKEKIASMIIYALLIGFSFFAIPLLAKQENSSNIFTNELQANGLYKFFVAFQNNELEFEKFYPTLSNEKAFELVHQQIQLSKGESMERTITIDSAEMKKNVVLITVESLSEEFLEQYGDTKHLTPFLSDLANKSLQFTNLYATGNRTVRGLEAVTLCLPPSAAESVVKREDNKNKFSTGSVFKKKGYTVKYMYGGDAFFDNMESFFGGNGYEILDKKTLKPEEITFSNIWGVCDEDMYNKAIKEMNKEAALGKPFFNHIMTVSNHRPFTYPEGKIDIPGNSKSRDGGVKYTDYALQQFFKMAEKQSWFNNTVFVIVADHCASSSGKTELPLEKYRIPALVYAPGFIAPKHENRLMSQIDLMPTVLGLLNFSYTSSFFGQDIYHETYTPRAFIATYQDLGMIKNNVLTIISPVKKVKQFDLKIKQLPNVKPEYQSVYEEIPRTKIDQRSLEETIAFYQMNAFLLKKKK